MTDTGPGDADAPGGPDEVEGPLRRGPDPYADEDLSTYPDWWRENVELFREYDLPPYRPPRFTDGTHTPTLVADLEDDLGVSIRFQAVDPPVDGTWTVLIDGDSVASVDKRRVSEGYTEYDITATEFEHLVREAVERDRDAGDSTRSDPT